MVNLSQKSIFLQALIASTFIFIIGFLIGIHFENTRVDAMKDIFYDSETMISDFEVASGIIFDSNKSCETIVEKSVLFADKIYSEALKLEKYDNSNKLTQRFMPLHRRYDLLRTILWKDLIKNKKLCNININTLIYVYEYVDPTIETKGIQGAMSNYLGDLKNKFGDDIILIPIAADTNLDSLDSLKDIYNLTKVPVIFVNEKYKFETLDSLKGIDKIIDMNIDDNNITKNSSKTKSR